MERSTPLSFSRDRLDGICRRFRVAELALFGSAAKGTENDDSDLDILVGFEPDARPTLVTLARLARELSEVFGRRVDLVPKRGLKSSIREEVLATAEVLHPA